jgi:hypothetical protein
LTHKFNKGYETVAKLLLVHGIDADFKDKCIQTLLWWAARDEHEAVVKLLLANDGVTQTPRTLTFRRCHGPYLIGARW